MRKLLASITLALALLAVRPASAQYDPVSELIGLVNALRVERGVAPYEVDWQLMSAAKAQTVFNAANGFSSHTGAGGTTPNDRALAANYGGGFPARATENNAEGTIGLATPAWVVELWQGDDVHLRAMVSPDFEHIGVGYVEADGKVYYTMMVGWIDEGSPPPAPSAGDALSGAASAPLTVEVASPAPPEPIFVKATPGPDGSIVHEAQEGQTLWTIAANHGLSVEDLLALNGLAEDSVLYPGDHVVIRPADPVEVISNEEQARPVRTPAPLPEAAPRTVSAPQPLDTPPPRITPLAAEEGANGEGGSRPVRSVATGAVVGLGLIGGALVGWAVIRRRRVAHE
jgi:LysM repeat protein